MSAAVETEDRGGDAVEQVAVVGDEDERAGEVEEIFFEDFKGGDVEVVGGLVEEEDVGGFEHELGDEDAGSFTAGKIADGLVELLAGEEEARGPAGDMRCAALVDDGVGFRGESAAEGEAVVELAHLAEVDEAQGFGAADGAGGRLDFSAKEAEEGGFAAAVGADEADFHAGGEDEVQAGEEGARFRG